MWDRFTPLRTRRNTFRSHRLWVAWRLRPGPSCSQSGRNKRHKRPECYKKFSQIEARITRPGHLLSRPERKSEFGWVTFGPLGRKVAALAGIFRTAIFNFKNDY